MRRIKGKTGDEMYGRGMEVKSMDSKMYFPNISIPLDAIPEAKDWKPSKTYRVTLDLKMTGLNLRRNGDNKDSGDSNYEIHGVEVGKIVKEKSSGRVEKRYEEDEDEE